MGIDLDRFLVETAQKVVTTRTGDGDINYGASSDTPCLYRDISSMKQNNNREETMIDGLLWFRASEVIERGDIYYHPDEGYLRIMRIVKAKRLVADNTHQFVKCEVRKQRQIS